MEHRPVVRIRILFLIIVILAVVLAGRLFFIQIIKGSYYAERADRQYQLPAGNLLERGSIYFQAKDGQLVSAATMHEGYIVAINPRLITNPDRTYEALAPLITLDPADFYRKVAKNDDPYEELSNRVEQVAADKIMALKLTGVSVLKNRWRAYPGNSLAAQVIGFMGSDGKEVTGRYGLERYYNDTLTREPDKSFISFIAEAFSEIGGTVKGDEEAGGRDEANLVLTIEPSVQQTLEQSLEAVATQYYPDTTGAIVMDPKTGEIIAMGAWPTFDPGGKIDSLDVLKNPLVQNIYEMGSIFKPLTLAAGLDAGVITPTTTYNDVGILTIDTKQIANFDRRARGVIPMQEVINQSLNTGAVFVMQKLGKDRFREYFTNFGLGEKTGIDLPDEATGLINNLKSPREVEYATASFGQGVAVSPIEITRALASLGNGGYLVKPYIVKRFERVNTKLSTDTKPVVGREVIKPATSQAITKMLVTAVDTALVQGRAKLDHYTIAAKTGTAQMPIPGGGYYTDRYLHSFFGYFPASNPRFIVFLYMVNPKGVQYASESLVSPFMNLTKFLLNYYNVPPDR